ncbi:MAG TPA: sialidase family protein [Pyrinomonadaceae bacterium]|nr:sialidase family protein [Pyrinomonadaceae bacterium]
MKRRILCAFSLIIVGALIPILPSNSRTLESPALSPSNGYVAESVIQISEDSPFAGCDISGQGGINFLNTEIEPYLAINPTNHLNIVAAWQQDWWSNGGSRGFVTSASFDGGLTWMSAVPQFSYCSGGTSANGGDFERAADAWITFAPNGDVYLVSLSLSGFSAVERAILVSKSMDGGLTWSAPATLDRKDVLTSLTAFDKPSIIADPLDSTKVYAPWSQYRFPSEKANPLALQSFAPRIDGYFASTVTAGQSWQPPYRLFVPESNEGSEGHQVEVTPTGSLIDIFDLRKAAGAQPKFPNYRIVTMRSTDGGGTWSGLIDVAAERAVIVTNPDTGAPIRAATFALPDIAADLNPASASYGNLYAVWNDAASTFNAATAYDNIVFTRSTDGGMTWTPIVEIDHSPAGIQSFMPAIAVASDGTIGVTYYDFRNNTSAPGLPTDYWFVQCNPSSDCTNTANWHETHVAGPFDIERANIGGARGAFIGDYQGLAAGGADFLAAFVQTTATDRANVYFARIRRQP